MNKHELFIKIEKIGMRSMASGGLITLAVCLFIWSTANKQNTGMVFSIMLLIGGIAFAFWADRARDKIIEELFFKPEDGP